MPTSSRSKSPEGDAGLGGERHGPDFQNLHRNKRSLTLNLKAPEGLAVMKRLVAQADVVVENYRPDVKFRLGVDYESLKAINKRIVYASISGFGQDGPYRDRPGFDQIAQGMGGLMSITGEPGRGPMRVGIPVADLTAGIFAAMGILIALLEREQSGEGQWVKSSLLGAQISMLDFQAARWTIGKEVPGPGRQQPSDQHPDRRVRDRRRLYQHRRRRRRHLSSVVQGAGRRTIWRQIRCYRHRPGPVRQPRCAERGDRGDHARQDLRRVDRGTEQGRRAVAGRSTR